MTRIWPMVLLSLTLFSLPAAAGPWPTANAAYQGTRVMSSGGAVFSGRLFHDRGKERWEMSMEGMTQVMIMRPDIQKMFMVMPQMNMAMEMPLAAGNKIPTPGSYAGIEPEIVGQDVIAGEQTTKYKVEGNDGSGPYTVFFWMTPDGITMRTEGSSPEGSFEMHLEGLRRGEQSADLFEVPAGAQVMPANPAMVNQMMQGRSQ